MSVYDFDQQHAQGQRGEDYLDTFFEARGHTIYPATRSQQRQGIDRIFRKNGKRAAVEYKTDFVAHQTGHIFVETISVDADDKAGWAYTSQATMLVYFIPGLKTIYVTPLDRLREQLPGWCNSYPTRPAQNEDYATHGVLVPIAEFERHASQVLHPDLTGE